jgi:hypothetical protein
MKRIFLGFAVAVGLLAAGTTSASAAVLCHDDPTVGTSVPGVSLTTNVTVGGSNVYATSGSGSTSFGFTIGT